MKKIIKSFILITLILSIFFGFNEVFAIDDLDSNISKIASSNYNSVLSNNRLNSASKSLSSKESLVKLSKKSFDDLLNESLDDSLDDLSDESMDEISKESLNDSSDEDQFRNGYKITSYHVDINVDKYGIMDIKENITIYADESKHGIIRNIPIKNVVKRKDKTSYTNRAKITNLKVNDDFTISRDSENLKIKIGDANSSFTGEKTYTISYKYNIGVDKTDSYDELYYNIIGTEWDTSISNVSFKIAMPKEFDSSKVGFTHGRYGSNATDEIKFNVNNNVITGSYSGVLEPNEGLTIRCELPERYFEKQEQNITFTDILIITISITLIAVGFLIWNKYGKDKKPVETVEFYPPKGLSSLDVAYFYYGKIENKQVISLLIELANKGYIKIEEEKKKKIISAFDKNEYKIYPLKNLNEISHNKNTDLTNDNNFELTKEELIFYKGLIRCMSDDKNYITKDDLKENFYLDINRIITSEKKKKKLIFEGNKKIQMIVYPIIILILTLLLTIVSIKQQLDFTYEFIFFPLGISIFLTGLISEKNVKESIICNFIGIVVIGTFLLTLFFNVTEYFISTSAIGIAEFIITFISIIANIILCNLVTNRTDYGVEMLGKIGGFRNFLITAEKDRLEKLVNENPEYFYNILPYTYALNVSNKWIKKFEDIALEPPSWYQYDDMSTFNSIMFINSLDRSFNSIEDSMISKPSSNSGFSVGGGGFSGGGFSGGGSGGGGGSSW